MKTTTRKWMMTAALACSMLLGTGGVQAGGLLGGCFGSLGCDDNCCDTGCGETACCDLGCYDDVCCEDSCCDGGCDCLPDCSLDSFARKLDCCGLVQKSDTCFDDFISPMINFVYFEDPRTLTELRPIFVSHNVPDTIGAGVTAGGSIQLYAAQFRIALSERLSLIAVKDGYIVDNTNGVLGDNLLSDGWAAVTAGLKYNLIRDTCKGQLVSAGLTYELPIGSQRALQDVGDGEFHLFMTAGQRLCDGDAHMLSSFGFRLPADSAAQSTSFHWSNHLDYRLSKNLYAFTEMAWWHWIDEAQGAAAGVAGQDLFNLGFSGIEGKDLVTQNVGLKIKPRRNVETGIAYEFPITGFQDVIEDRIQIEAIFRY